MPNDLLEEILFEIFNGFSVFDSKFGPIYIKHFHALDSSKILLNSKHYLEDAKKRGMPTEQEVLDGLIKEGMWSEDQDAEIADNKETIRSRNNVIASIKIPSKLEEYKKETEVIKSKTLELEREKTSLLGTTAEVYSNRKSQKEFLESLLFFDKEFKNPVFGVDEESNMDKEIEFAKIHKSFFEKFTDINISTMVLSGAYSPYLPFSESVIDIYGKPLKELTAFQVKTMSYARNFLNIFKNAQEEIPENVARDPELLIDFSQSKKTSVKNKGSENEGGTTYLGATQEDIEKMKAEDENAVVLSEEIEKQGGALNMKQMMKLHGV